MIPSLENCLKSVTDYNHLSSLQSPSHHLSLFIALTVAVACPEHDVQGVAEVKVVVGDLGGGGSLGVLAGGDL